MSVVSVEAIHMSCALGTLGVLISFQVVPTYLVLASVLLTSLAQGFVI